MSDEEAYADHYLRVTVDLIVEVGEVNALQAAALADLRAQDLDAQERQDQIDQINSDPSGASALRWLISPDDVLALVDRIDEVQPVEAILEISESDGVLELEDED
ncbi:hypothetical protein [Actinocorallia longicatena]|uniref:Uncharacterized protein n=1 Tax=Actinocorallia longicatena TaxID=111803 RepID=A0ABP6QFD4_9ACTN